MGAADEQDIWVEQSRNGDHAAFAALIRTHQPMIHSLTYRMTGSVADAKDLAQETFIRAYQQLDSFNGAAKFSSWLYRIAVNVCLDWQRREARRSRLHDGLLIQDVVAIASAGGKIFVAGDRMKVYSSDLKSFGWTILSPPKGRLGMVNNHLGLAGCNRWLLFEAESINLYDTILGTWTNLPGVDGIALADSSGFWVGGNWNSGSNLHFIDPNTMQVRSYTLPNIHYGIAAIASDKEYVWVACKDETIMIFNKTSHTWTKSFKMPCVITAFAFSVKTAWLGGDGSLFEIEKIEVY
jgi:RNA polymerase sigma factor (sigma-70 family)